VQPDFALGNKDGNSEQREAEAIVECDQAHQITRSDRVDNDDRLPRLGEILWSFNCQVGIRRIRKFAIVGN
jgi:hypothetical protein